MELHSYAKRRLASKKWNTEQKRKLVEARITYDGIFSKKPSNCLTTWKKITTLAKLDEFSVSFVRKQWSNMVAKYKQYKNRLGNVTTNNIDDESLRKISQEWEFFYPIHCFMSRKVTNLHSYALTEGQEKQRVSSYNNLSMLQDKIEEQENNSTQESQVETMMMPTQENVKSGENISTPNSDTNKEFEATDETTSNITRNNGQEKTYKSEAQTLTQMMEEEMHCSSATGAMKNQNTDHDFYSKKSPEQKKLTNGKNIETEIKTEISDDNTQVGKEQEDPTPINSLCTFAETQKQMNVEILQNNSSHVNYGATCSSKAKPTIMVMIPKEEPKEPDASRQKNGKPKPNERDKYYRHKRRYNRRLERRFDALLNVFGQIVKAEYPSIDVSPLFGKRTTTEEQQQTAQSGFFGEATFSSDEISETEMSTSHDERVESLDETTIEDDE